MKDGATKQILVECVSSTLELSHVERNFERLLERLDGNIHPEAIIHSDQDMHYTHPKVRRRITNGFMQSMSRRGTCWDNASMESFFGHMKDEVNFSDCQSLDEGAVQHLVLAALILSILVILYN
ncbi:transposase family protein [Paenibacillus apiarius]|nr:transposase family protein [Paenibacillus apiarius]